MIKSSITGVQQLQNELKKEMAKLSPDKYVLVGLNEGLGKHNNSDLTVAEIGAIQQFGTPTIPARPWLDTGVEKAVPEINRIIEKAYESGEFDQDRALELIGISAVNNVQENITDIRTPPNAPSTIDKKGSSNPLIDTGQMRQSVTYVITKDKPQEGI